MAVMVHWIRKRAIDVLLLKETINTPKGFNESFKFSIKKIAWHCKNEKIEQCIGSNGFSFCFHWIGHIGRKLVDPAL